MKPDTARVPPADEAGPPESLSHALQESEQRFSRFMQHLPGLAWIKDIDGRYVFANDAAVRAFQKSRDDLYGRTDDEIFSPETAAQFKENDRRALSGETGVQTLETLLHDDGVVHTSIVSKFPILGAGGEVSMVGGMAIDITERIQAEQALGQSESRFRELANSMPAIVWMTPPVDGPEFVNQWYYEYTGLPHETPGSEGWALVVHPDDSPRAFSHFSECQKNRTVWEHQLRLRRFDGVYRWFLSRCVPLLDEAGDVRQWLGTSVDIHDRKLAEEDLELRVSERTAQLEAAVRELEGFTYSVSHDLRGPVRNIVATSRMLQEDHESALPTEAREMLESQARSANRLGELIDELLKLSRVARYELRRQQLDISKKANEIGGELLGRTWPAKIDLAVENGLTAEGDPDLVRLVLQNLLENAFKFSPNGGTVRVGSNGKEIFVQDEGVGFDMQYVHKLFQPFERLVRDDQFQGTGIGLANVERIVRRHGGTVRAESKPGGGATFFFTLSARSP